METIKKWWFYVSAFIIGVGYFVFAKRGRTIKELKNEIITAKVGQELKAIADRASGDYDSYERSRAGYLKLKARHPELFGDPEQLRQSLSTVGPSAEKPPGTADKD